MKLTWQHPSKASYTGIVSFKHNETKTVDDAVGHYLLKAYPIPSRVPDADLMPANFNKSIGWFTQAETADQCEAIAKYTGERCKNKKVPGERYCQAHLAQISEEEE